MTNFVIREMKDIDVDTVFELEKVIFTDAWSYKMIKDEVDGQYFKKPYVMILNEKIVGYAFIWIIDDEIHLNNFAIHPEFRRKGLGLKLISFIFDELHNYRVIFLEVRISNHSAISLYQKVGFRELLRRKGYYSDGEDAIVMQKKLR